MTTTGPEDEDDHTRVVAREVPPETEDDHTRVVDRVAPSPDDDDHTRVVARDLPIDDEDDHTRVVAKEHPPHADEDQDDDTRVVGDRPGRRTAPSAAAPTVGSRADRRRRGIAYPPVPQGFGPGAHEAVGPGAIESYQARAVTQPPADPVIEEGVEATRAPAPSMPSVHKRSRRAARTAMALYVCAWIGAVAGAILIVVALL